MSTITIYLLHFDRDVHGKRHYIGSTKTENLHKRLRAHTMGYGANITTRASLQGVDNHLAATWTASTRDNEKRMKRNGHLKAHCVYCNGQLAIERRIENKTAAPVGTVRPTWTGYQFQTFQRGNRKGSGTDAD